LYQSTFCLLISLIFNVYYKLIGIGDGELGIGDGEIGGQGDGSQESSITNLKSPHKPGATYPL
ncbi:MAG: hypothetical protein AAFY21_04930, partial [Cyanobacteria bacterium J06641_2]